MSRWLVDTHALLWFLDDDPQLSPAAKYTMESERNALLVSAASVWEIAIKAALGRLDVPIDLPTVLRDQGFDELGITAEHTWAVRHLAVGAHKDPFDRLLAAQARIEQVPIISGNAQFDQYEVARHW